MSLFVPYVEETGPHGPVRNDLFSRLLKDRIIMLSSGIDDQVASIIVAQLLFLENQDNSLPINIYVNSPGGSIVAGYSIIDCMNLIKAPVHTTVCGMAASMGALITVAGEKRRILPNSRMLLHQPLAGFNGQASDIKIAADNILKWKSIVTKYLAERTGQPLEKVSIDCDRDFILDAQECVDYGLVHEIIGQK